jgi:predicted alpha/beta hydrolase family esterase
MMINFWNWFQKDNTVSIEIESPVEDIIQDNNHYVFIHGANQSRVCWNYVIRSLEPNKYTTLEYDTNNKFYYNLDSLSEKLETLDGDLFLVGHSLGGVYGLHLYNMFKHKFNGAVTVSTPYGGSRTADWAKYMVPSYNLFREIGVRSKPIASLKDISIEIPWTQIVTTRGGAPWHGGANDGVVTYDSMTLRDDMQYIEVAENHYEILASDDTVEIIKKLAAKT